MRKSDAEIRAVIAGLDHYADTRGGKMAFLTYLVMRTQQETLEWVLGNEKTDTTKLDIMFASVLHANSPDLNA